MPKRALPLTVKKVENEKRPGSYSDGHGLYLVVGQRSKSWIFRYQLAGRRHDLGLGSAALVSLREARDRVLDLHRDIRDGKDPLAVKRTGRAAHRQMITFKEAGDRYIAAHEAGRKDKKSWPDHLRLYINPKIGNLGVDLIDDDHVLACVEPLWTTNTVTATRVRARIEKILDWCVTNKYRPEGANPARWRGHLENLLPKPGKVTKAKHHNSLPWQEAPEFMSKLVLDTGIPGTAAAFAILTCTRASEAAGARWPEIDLGARTWTIPAERMKAGETHRVPLTAGALAILHRMAQIKSNSDDRLFLARSGRLRAQSMLKAVQRVHEGITLHGFRSTFRVWARETKKDWAASELALAHDVRTKTQAAYDRGDRLEERRPIMEDWAAFIAT